MEHVNTISLLLGVIGSGLVGAVVAVATLRAKIRKENSEAAVKYIEAKQTLMDFTQHMDVRMADYVNQLQMTRQRILEIEEMHLEQLKAEREKTDIVLSQLNALKIEWEIHKQTCPVFTDRSNGKK